MTTINERLNEYKDLPTTSAARAAQQALLSAVEQVLALCDEYAAQARGDNPDDRLRQAARKAVASRFRAALSSALGVDA